jgi:hypothetical protein
VEAVIAAKGDQLHINAHDFGMIFSTSRCPHTFGHVVDRNCTPYRYGLSIPTMSIDD